MTQPLEAVGGATNDDPVVAAEPTLEDRFAALAEEPQDEPQPSEEESPPEEDAPTNDEPEAEDVSDDALPPIQAPVSWTAEEKEEFSQLPRALQETLSRREVEREKFVQSKAQEAKQARAAVMQQAAAEIETAQNLHIQQLQALLPEVPPRPPARLQVEDPYAYADQLELHEWALAQHQQVQQVRQHIAGHQKQMNDAVKAEQAQLSAALLKEQFPEFLDETKGPELKQALLSTARALGYSDDQLAQTDAQDVLAMRQAHEWKAKADKYDALVAKKMENVRAAKTLPKVSRPGTPQRGVVANERYQADRQAMRSGDRDAGARVFSKFL